jgi:predicted TIM-barrel enzyme
MGDFCLSIMCRHYRDMLNQSIFIVADFGRCNKSVARLAKDVVAPYVHVLPSYQQDNAIDPFSLRKTLLFFQGRIHRKNVSSFFLVLL